MKKILFGTTALMAVGMLAGQAVAADKIKLGLGGYWRGVIHVGDTDNDASPSTISNREHGFGQESEVYFSGKTKLDNGIQFGVMVQLEGETSGDQIDNTYIWSAGSFGRVEFGETWGPSLLMSYGSVGDMLDGHGDFASHSPQVNHNGLGIVTYGGDAGILFTPEQKINYFTPRMAGFQLGVSYIPENYTLGAGGTTNVTATGTSGNSDIGNGGAATRGNELFDIAANYTGKFGGASIAGFGSYFTSETEPAGAGALAGQDVDGYSLGGQVGWGGFRVGGRYVKLNDIGPGGAIVAAGAPGTDRKTWRIGVDYKTGPWGIGIAYMKAEQDVAATGAEDETTYVSLGGTYALGPGIKLYGGLQFWDHDDDANALAAQGDTTIGVIGTKFSF